MATTYDVTIYHNSKPRDMQDAHDCAEEHRKLRIDEAIRAVAAAEDRGLTTVTIRRNSRGEGRRVKLGFVSAR